MAEQVFDNKDAELSGARLLEQAGSCRGEAENLRWLRLDCTEGGGHVMSVVWFYEAGRVFR